MAHVPIAQGIERNAADVEVSGSIPLWDKGDNMMFIGFDFDGTLDNAPHFEQFVKLISPILNEQETFILTTRDKITSQVQKKVRSLNLNTHSNNMIAIGHEITSRIFDSKAHFIQSMNMRCDLFFDNDPYEIEDLRKNNISCIWIPEMDKDSLMWEITEAFFDKRKHGI